MEVGQRDLGGRDEVQVALLHFEQIGLELGELAGSEESIGAHEKRRQHLDIAVLFGMEIEHELDERPLEPCAGTHQNGETRPRDLRRPVEVQNSQSRSDVPVGFRLEGEVSRLSPATDLLVRGLVRSHGDALVGKVGKALDDPLAVRLDLFRALFFVLDELRGATELEPERLRLLFLPVLHESADVLRFGLVLVAHGAQLGLEPLPFLVERAERREVDVGAAIADPSLDELEVAGDEVQIEHVEPF